MNNKYILMFKSRVGNFIKFITLILLVFTSPTITFAFNKFDEAKTITTISHGNSINNNPILLTNTTTINLNLPQNNSVLHQTIPQFSWSNTNTTLSPFAGTYEIEIDNNSDFSSPEDIDQMPSFINYYSTDFELSYNTVYYWRVRFVDVNNTQSEWSTTNSFSIEVAEDIVDVLETDGWDEIREKWQTVLTKSTTTTGSVELRFPINGILNVKQDPNSDEANRSNGFLLYVNGYDNIIVNGRGSKITIEATHGGWLCGFMEINNSNGIQVKDIIIDYHKNSLLQIVGVVKNFDKVNKTFEVTVDTNIYDTYEVLKDYDRGYFLDKENQQKIGLKGVHYTMEQTWEEARINETTYRFTCGTSEYGRYRDELSDGDYFVKSERSGDVFFLRSNVTNFVINNITTHASRGRYFAISEGSYNIRSINNKFLRAEGRIMGSSSGGVGVDRGDNVWYENNRYEYTRDDMFHNGSNAGKGSVFRNNELIGAYRNSIWVQADRTWVAGNKIDYAGTNGIHIGYAPSNPGTMPETVLVENNTITKPNWYGILVNSNPSNPDFETGSIYNENVIIRNNHIIDNFRDEAIYLTYLKNAIINNNLITNTINDWSVYSSKELQRGIYVSNSDNVIGCDNQILDNRIENKDFLFIEDSATNIDLCLFNQLSIDKNDIKNQKLTIYPIPCSIGIFFTSRFSDYTVYSIQGKKISHFKKTNRIDLSDSKNGTYILKDDKTKESAKILKFNK